MDLPPLAQLLTTLRERAGLSIPEVIEKLKTPRATAYQWEKHGRPEPENLGPLLDLYGATDDERLEAWRLRSLPRAEPEADLPAEKGAA